MVYIVTKESDDGTFGVGDRISFQPDGSIVDYSAEGWIEADQAKEAATGMEYQPDKEWIDKRRKKLLDELDTLKKGEE